MKIQFERLNDRANEIVGAIYADETADEYASAALNALESVAAEQGMALVAEDETCAIYRTVDGQLINCWVAGVSSARIEDGGLGFDDQTEWYTDNPKDGNA